MSAWKKRNRRRRTSLKQLGPRYPSNVTVTLIDESVVRITAPEIEVMHAKGVDKKQSLDMLFLRGAERGPENPMLEVKGPHDVVEESTSAQQAEEL